MLWLVILSELQFSYTLLPQLLCHLHLAIREQVAQVNLASVKQEIYMFENEVLQRRLRGSMIHVQEFLPILEVLQFTIFQLNLMMRKFLIYKDKYYIISLKRGIWKKKKRIQMNKRTYLQNRNRLTGFENKPMDTTEGRCRGKEWTWGLGLAYTHWSIWNDWLVATCCIAQGTLLNILW